MNKTLLLAKDDAGWEALYYTTTNIKEGSYVVTRDNGLSVQKVAAVVTIEANSPYESFLMKFADIKEIPPIVGIVQEVNNRITHIDDDSNPI